MSRRNLGFTLSETLITLGVIGVVAVLTLPTFIKNKNEKELEAAFKKSYSALYQVATRVVNEDYGGVQPIIDGDRSMRNFIEKFQKHYIKSVSCTLSACSSRSIFPMGASAFQSFISAKYKTYNGKSPDILCNDGILATNDGSFLFFDWANSDEVAYGKTLIGVDTNGWAKKPNKFGHDFFIFYINKSGQFLPMGVEGSLFPQETYCDKESNSSSNGYGCAVKALNEKDYFKNLP